MNAFPSLSQYFEHIEPDALADLYIPVRYPDLSSSEYGEPHANMTLSIFQATPLNAILLHRATSNQLAKGVSDGLFRAYTTAFSL